MHYFCNYKPLKSKKFKDQKDFKVKKNHHPLTTNSNNEIGNKSQPSQALGWFFNKNYY